MASGHVPDSVNFADSDFEAKVMRMLESLDLDVEMSNQEDYVEESEHDTDFELDLEPNEEFDPSNNQSVQVSDNDSTDNENPNYYYEPDTDIVGGPELFIDRGSTINLTCVVRNSPEPPAFIFWNHNDEVSTHYPVCRA
ncbi:unnamed protein product [Acanthoscelides obtectus]|uniref:Ig-like domain-containing protein n=1 Tax=Acanthoscelides obtectus TaxID=200917 RepID=A0A9P0PPU8_ACAOB|nr:unnamed protein product [Acanthoscelides obtectus]CAK1624873.1 hypothetical protein AOBTE_LOCUS2812 [Acanthoscelides obtectus]